MLSFNKFGRQCRDIHCSLLHFLCLEYFVIKMSEIQIIKTFHSIHGGFEEWGSKTS